MCRRSTIISVVSAVIFEGRKFRGFRCTFAKREIFVLEKKQSLKETMYAPSWSAKNKPRKSFHTCFPRNLRPSKITAYTVCRSDL